MPTSEEPAVTTVCPRRSPGVGLSKEKKSTPPGKKLVQARLPFKRLNPVPKEKVEGVSDVKKVKPSQNASSQNRLPKLDTSMDSLENDCQLNPEIVSPPLKTVNGKGPLDQFLKRRTDLPDPSAITIDLTEDSNSAHGCSKELNAQKDASNRTVQQVKIPLKPDLSNRNDQSEVPMETDEPSLNTLAFTNGDSKDKPSNLSNVLSDGKSLTMSQENRAVIFQGKKPVVVLEDIMMTKPALLGTREGSVVFKDSNEVVESHIEVESASPVSSPSVDSSPVAGRSPVNGNSPLAESTQENKNSTSPSSLTTPRRKIPLKTSKPSSEKKLMDQEEKKKKMQAEREERERLKEEAKNAKERAKEEAKRKKEEEKELKDKEKKEKKDKEEQEKKEKKEKEEKEKAEKLRLKEEKRKEKQDALEAKLEEKRKKEEEKRAKEEEKRIKAGKSEITRFFQKPKTQNTPKTFASSCGKFAPFEIKKNMALAPLCRVDFDQAASDKLDELLQSQTLEVSYLKELKYRKPRTSGRTVVHHHIVPANSDVIVENGETDDVQEMPDDPLNSDLLEDDTGTMGSVPERKTFGRMKLLQFSENYRPAYWGTWNKASTVIHPRKPWLKDEVLDYEVDSDEEWEEEEPGESLSHSEGDDDEEAGDDEEDDDGFFVPHGYLSDDEGAAEEERTDPENQKVRQKLKAKEWDELVSEGKKFRVLKPLVIGCIWESSEASREMKALQRFAACILESVIAEEELAQEKCEKRKIKDQQILEKLLPLLHGNFNGSKVIIHEFQECCRRGLLSEGSEPGHPESSSTSPISPNTSRPSTPTAGENALIPSKARLKRIISENSTYEKRPDFRMCWYVHAEVLKRFDQQALPVPCQWTYLTQVNPAAKEDSLNSLTTPSTQATPVSVKRKSSGSMSITKFMKRPKEVKQVGMVETDGFQADTEDEDDEDCIVVDVQQNKDGITAAAKTTTLSVKTSPSSASVPCLSNPTTLNVLEPECAMEVVPSEAPATNMNRAMESGITGDGMVSNNHEVKTVPHGNDMLCIDNAMDTIPSNDSTICDGSGKTASATNAVHTVKTPLHCESKTETDGVCLENTIPKTSSAGGIVDITSAMESIPATSALISIPNQA
ncbi:chromatin assembly factor 1 subunit A isoform X2 [Pleurodeles waltl]|uniref:chromatin assembly factor 1 subunit A isoform X2 n=1 Tax=Pleurodeles waltl TaxID=8319 RepID=UPI003709B4A1